MALSIEKKTEKYVDTPLTEFPVKEDNFDRMSDVTSDLVQLVLSYNQYFQSGNITECNKLLQSNPRLLSCFLTADKYNQLRDGLIALQRFTLEEIEEMINDVAQHAIGINDNPEDTEKHLVSYSAQKVEELLKYTISSFDKVVPVTFLANNWLGEQPPYTQAVNIELISSEDTPTLVKYWNEDFDLAKIKAYNKAFGILSSGYGDTGNQTVTWTCAKKPAIDITIGLQGLKVFIGQENFTRAGISNMTFDTVTPDEGATGEHYGQIESVSEVTRLQENYENKVFVGDLTVLNADEEIITDDLFIGRIYDSKNVENEQEVPKS